MKLCTDAMKKYQKEGLASLFRGGLRYIKYRGLSVGFDAISLDRDELISYAKSKDSIYFYAEEEKFTVKEPITGGVPEEYRHLVRGWTCSPNFVCELSNARLIGPYAIPQTSTGQLVIEPMGKKSMLRNRLKTTCAELGTAKTIGHVLDGFVPRNREPDYETVFSMIPRHGKHVGHSSYGHWIAEDLPRLRGIEHYQTETGEKPKLLIRPDPPSWMTETLELLGYTSEHMIEWNEEVAQIGRLIMPSLRYLHTFDYDPCPSDKKWLRETVLENNHFDESTDFSEYVLLSRQGTNRRRIANYDEVFNVLESYGFQSYRMENLSIKEQIQLCSNAKIMIGANGSNMINAIWADDATIIALFPPNWFGVDSLMIANERKLEYDFLVGTQEADQEGDRKDLEEDIVVDIEELEEVVKRVI